MRRVVGFAIACCATILACDRLTSDADPGYVVNGTVTDSVTGSPIDSARVWLDDSIATRYIITDTTGSFGFAVVGERPKTVLCSHAGYRAREVDVPGSGTTARVDISLAPLIEIE